MRVGRWPERQYSRGNCVAEAGSQTVHITADGFGMLVSTAMECLVQERETRMRQLLHRGFHGFGLLLFGDSGPRRRCDQDGDDCVIEISRFHNVIWFKSRFSAVPLLAGYAVRFASAMG